MAHPTGTLSYPDAGVLRFFVCARWSSTTGDFGSPDLNIGNVRIRAFMGETGDYTYTSVIDKFTQATFIDLDYPGGDEEWDVGTETVDYDLPDTLVTIALRDIRVAWELVKK